MRSRQTIVAVACLTLGAAEVAYLNLEVAPALVGADTPRTSAVASRAPEPEIRSQPEREISTPRTAAPLFTAAAPIELDQRTGPVPAPDVAGSVRSVRITFARDDATLGDRARDKLAHLAEQLVAEPSLAAAIDGHTDRLGEPAHNDLLSQDRAEAVADHLVGLGVARERLTVRWFGETRPLADGAGRRNRRVEVRLGPATEPVEGDGS